MSPNSLSMLKPLASTSRSASFWPAKTSSSSRSFRSLDMSSPVINSVHLALTASNLWGSVPQSHLRSAIPKWLMVTLLDHFQLLHESSQELLLVFQSCNVWRSETSLHNLAEGRLHMGWCLVLIPWLWFARQGRVQPNAGLLQMAVQQKTVAGCLVSWQTALPWKIITKLITNEFGKWYPSQIFGFFGSLHPILEKLQIHFRRIK